MLAPDGRCKTLDAAADGYVRSEACAMLRVVSHRVGIAGDKVGSSRRDLVLIAGAAVNQDGRSSSLTAPNGPAQQEAIRTALRKISDGGFPHDVVALQMHGTGTSLGDPIEVGAACAVLTAALTSTTSASSASSQQSRTCPLVSGALKSALGHAEPAAGVLGLLAAQAALQGALLQPLMQLRNPSQHISAVLDASATSSASKTGIMVTLPKQKSQHASGSRNDGGGSLASVSAFAFQGTNAHVVLQIAPGGRREDNRTFTSIDAACARRFADARRHWAIPVAHAWLRQAAIVALQPTPLSRHHGCTAVFDIVLSGARSGPATASLLDHVIHGRAICPAAAFLEAGMEAIDQILRPVFANQDEGGDAAVCVSAIPQPLEFPESRPSGATLIRMSSLNSAFTTHVLTEVPRILHLKPTASSLNRIY